MIGRKGSYALVAAAFAVFSMGEVSAQQALGGNAHPGSDKISLSVYGGGLFATTTLSTEADFEDSGAVGGTATLWLHDNWGLRANALRSRTEILAAQPGVTLEGEDPDIWHFSGDLILRLPLPSTQRFSWFPYAIGGVGAKMYDFATAGTETDLAGNFGAGIEFRFGDVGRWGIYTEVRDFVSNFDRLGIDETLHDVVWTGGISLNF